MDIRVFKSGLMANNTYVLEQDGVCAIIDPARRNTKLFDYIDGKKVEYILLTHGHFDHVWDAGKLRDLTGAKIAIHGGDTGYLEYELDRAGTPGKADIILSDGDEIFSLKVMHTPGHSKGSVCFVKDDVIFSGDMLFKGTVGRTDFDGGDMQEMMDSIDKLKALDGDFKVYPGHNDETTLDAERKENPWFNR